MTDRKWLIPILLLSFLLNGCYRKFYQTNSVSNPPAEKYQAVNPDSALVIIHFSDNIIQLNEIQVSNDSITGKPGLLEPVSQKHLKPHTDRPNPFKKKDRKHVLRQVHIYLDMPYKPEESIVILRSQVKRFDMYGFDQQATRKSSVLSTIGLILSPAVVFLIAILLFSVGWNS